jgi:hypothetical protein
MLKKKNRRKEIVQGFSHIFADKGLHFAAV